MTTDTSSEVCVNHISARMKVNLFGGDSMAWDGDALAEQMEEAFERQHAAADARAHRETSTPAERARSAKFQSLRVSRSRIMSQLSLATNASHRQRFVRRDLSRLSRNRKAATKKAAPSRRTPNY